MAWLPSPRKPLTARTGYTVRMERRIEVFEGAEAADEADSAYYASLTPRERVDMLLELVERHRESLGEAAARFERVCRVAQLGER